MAGLSWGSWGAAEFDPPAPRWLLISSVIFAMVGAASDIDYAFRVGDLPCRTWVIALSYTSIGVVLLSARLALLFCVLAMATTFVGSAPFFVLIAVGVLTLVIFTLCRKALAIIHCVLVLTWASLLAWFIEPKTVSDPMAFWWTTLWVLGGTGLAGLGLRYLVVRTFKTRQRLAAVEALHEEVRREERQHLARELHDVVAHHITVITMNVMAHRKSRDPEELQAALGVIEDSAREALTELRALLDVLRSGETSAPEPLTEQIVPGASLGRQVDRHVASLKELGYQVTSVQVDPRIETQPLSLRTSCARILQEFVTNIMKHAEIGAACSINLMLLPTEMQLVIVNSHPNSAPRQGQGGYGLLSLQERVTAAGGRYSAGLRDGQWVAEVQLPIRNSWSSSDMAQ